jgi:hypothetical protein
MIVIGHGLVAQGGADLGDGAAQSHRGLLAGLFQRLLALVGGGEVGDQALALVIVEQARRGDRTTGAGARSASAALAARRCSS